MGPGRSSSLRIGGDPSAAFGLGRTSGAFGRPLDKGKGKIDEIKYPGDRNI